MFILAAITLVVAGAKAVALNDLKIQLREIFVALTAAPKKILWLLIFNTIWIQYTNIHYIHILNEERLLLLIVHQKALFKRAKTLLL